MYPAPALYSVLHTDMSMDVDLTLKKPWIAYSPKCWNTSLWGQYLMCLVTVNNRKNVFLLPVTPLLSCVSVMGGWHFLDFVAQFTVIEVIVHKFSCTLPSCHENSCWALHHCEQIKFRWRKMSVRIIFTSLCNEILNSLNAPARNCLLIHRLHLLMKQKLYHDSLVLSILQNLQWLSQVGV